MTTAPPEPDELTDDRLLGGRLRFFQPRRGYRVAIDPVLLAAAVPVGAGERVLDAGAGTGAAALCLAARVPRARVVGLERDRALLAVARLNAAANAPAAPIELVEDDLLARPATDAFDHVMTNPPYHPRAAASAPATASGAAAHLAEFATAEWLGACLARLRPGGRLTVIHRAEALPEILAALHGKAGDLVVFPLWPNVEAPAAKRVIVAARKSARGPARIARGLVLHGPGGRRFTDAAEAVLRGGEGLHL
jgi:tRNA1(Val) A37 N6-methylase TrmN6